MSASLKIIRHFDIVNFVLTMHRSMTASEMASELNLSSYQVNDICDRLCIKPQKQERKKKVFEKKKNYDYIQPDPRQPISRPAPSYNNIATPYGIATQMLIDQMIEENSLKSKK